MRKSDDNVNHVDNPQTGHAQTGDLLELVHSVMHAYRSMQYRLLRDGPHDITHMDGKVLGYFDRHPGATQSDLAEYSGRDKAQLARLIKGLRDRGLLEALVDETDRRSVKLTLTAEGRTVQRSLKQQGKKLGAKAAAGLSDAEQAQMLALLQRMKENLDAA